MEFSKELWSENLRKIKPEVKNIFYKGNAGLLVSDSPKLAIVGSRRMTDYGRRVIEKWMPELVNKRVTIVSGFMYGVDQMAHKSCLENGGKTIAVLGWGIENKIVSEDQKLYDKILEVDSLILSEWQNLTGNRASFPQRNRIVAGISDAVLVIEGAERSGSMITARLARSFGKKLMALPGHVTSSLAGGTNKLIKEGKAVMVTSVDDVLMEMGLNTGQLALTTEKQSDPLIMLLSERERSVDELVRILRCDLSDVLIKLTELSINDVVVERDGKFGLK